VTCAQGEVNLTNEEVETSKDLFLQTFSFKNQRPHIDDVQDHPFLWSPKRKVQLVEVWCLIKRV